METPFAEITDLRDALKTEGVGQQAAAQVGIRLHLVHLHWLEGMSSKYQRPLRIHFNTLALGGGGCLISSGIGLKVSLLEGSAAAGCDCRTLL